MRKYLITYGNGPYQATRDRLCRQAKGTGEFDEVIGYGPESLSRELISSYTYSCGKKGGYWSWKPDIIVTTLTKMSCGDILVYADAGSTIVQGREWKSYFKILERYDLIAQRIFLSTGAWTRRTLIDAFPENGGDWRLCRQFTSNVVILRKSTFTVKFANEWRRGMIEHPEWVTDVPEDERWNEYPEFLENRYDQSLYSALIYRALADEDTRRKVLAKWEHVEDIDPIRSHVIRITRLRNNQQLEGREYLRLCVRRVLKDYVRKLLIYYYPEEIRFRRFIAHTHK